MLRSQRHLVRDAIDRALHELAGIEIELPRDVESYIETAETHLQIAKRKLIDA